MQLQLPLSTDVPTSSRLQLLPFCSRILLEPSNDPPCPSYLTFSREHGMTSSRIDPALKRRLSGNIAQTRHPYLFCKPPAASTRSLFSPRCMCSDSTRRGRLQHVFRGARRVPHRPSTSFPGEVKHVPPDFTYYRAKNFRKDGSADI